MRINMNGPTVAIPDVEVHTSCVCYQKGDARTIRQFAVERGFTETVVMNSHLIVFILEGAARISRHEKDTAVTLTRGEFIFLTAGTGIDCEAEEACKILLVRVDNVFGKIPECHTFRFRRSNGAQESPQEKGIHPLQANERIRHFLEGLAATEGDGLKCSSYAQLIVGQLLFLIQVYYTQEEYTHFYSAILGPEVALSDFVYENWRTHTTVAQLAEALCMTVQQFNARFQKTFGESPGSWLKKRKADSVYHDVCSSHKTLKGIAIEYGFGSRANFTRYCRTNFGSPPGVIRERLALKPDCTSCGARPDAEEANG
jgi:AraC-like DNA-binding protein